MTAAEIHLALNHVPALGIIIGAVLLGYGLWRHEEGVQTASLGLLAVAGLAAIPVYLSGEPAEEIVEGLAGVSHEAIEAHETWAQYALISALLTAFGGLGALLARARDADLFGRIARGTLVLSLIASLLMIYTANLGGKVHHQELRGETATVEVEESHEE